MSKLEFTRGEIIASKYEVVDLLDENPLGVTYRVKHQKQGKFVRLTLLRPKIAGREQKDELLEIYRRVKDLQHASLLKVGELGEHEGVAYVTFEDFEGQTLRELLSEYRVEGKRFELIEAAQITNQILEGLDALHTNGFVLRGLRPEYILVNVRRTGPRSKNVVARVKILGSGFWDLVPTAQLAEDEFNRGESQYLPPEMKSFEPTATVRSDVYSAGVILYEMLTGTPPVGTFQLPATVRPDLPKFVNDIVELALANSPEDRYPTTSDFMGALQRTVQDAEVAGGESRPLITPIIWVFGALLLVCVSIVLWYLRPNDEWEKQQKEAADIELRNRVKDTIVVPSREELEALYAKHPPNMAYIPAGEYISGRMNKDESALPSEPLGQTVHLDAFLIDRFEHPNQLGAQAMMDVDYQTAEKLCAEQGKRLCTDQEWEKACKGAMNSIYGYETTNTPAEDYLPECGQAAGYPTGSKPECKSGYGAYDMSGNYREWTSTVPNKREGRRVVKGGSAVVSQDESALKSGTRCAYSRDESIGFKDKGMSFRCCRDIDAPPVATNEGVVQEK